MPTLISIRTKKAMSQAALSKASGVAVSTISNIESGKRKAMFVTRNKLAAALQVPVEHIDFE